MLCHYVTLGNLLLLCVFFLTLVASWIIGVMLMGRLASTATRKLERLGERSMCVRLILLVSAVLRSLCEFAICLYGVDLVNTSKLVRLIFRLFLCITDSCVREYFIRFQKSISTLRLIFFCKRVVCSKTSSPIRVYFRIPFWCPGKNCRVLRSDGRWCNFHCGPGYGSRVS